MFFFLLISLDRSRQNAIKDHTLEWLDMHFPGLFKHIHFGNHFALHGESKPKSEICRCIHNHLIKDTETVIETLYSTLKLRYYLAFANIIIQELELQIIRSRDID